MTAKPAHRTVSEDQLARVRRRMSMLAHDLAGRLGPMDAAGTLIGAAVGLLETTYGQAKTVDYLRGVAEELERDDDLPTSPVGHA
jgi:hypothetical protein